MQPPKVEHSMGTAVARDLGASVAEKLPPASAGEEYTARFETHSKDLYGVLGWKACISTLGEERALEAARWGFLAKLDEMALEAGGEYCPACDGKGHDECAPCEGAGELEIRCSCWGRASGYECAICGDCGRIDSTNCPACDGEGLNPEYCDECGGRGMVFP